MSRIGKKPIELPEGVQINLDGTNLTVKGPKGELTKAIHPDMILKIDEKEIVVERPSDRKDHRALHGTTRSIVANMVEGVKNGFEKKLELVGVGYRAAKSGDKLVLTVGFSHPVEMIPEKGIAVEVPEQTKITISGIDKERVGEFAANVRAVRLPEPYKGKGIRYAGERIRRKEGKTGK